MAPPRRIWLSSFLAAAVAALALAGCASVQKQTPLMKAAPEVKTTAQKLRFYVTILARDFGDEVEGGAEKIIAATDDVEIRRNALLWKLNAIPEAHLAAFQSDPLGAMMDVWVLSEQMIDFFTDGAGKDEFGEHQDIAVATSQRIHDNVMKVVDASTKEGFETGKGSQFVHQWAREHPIESLQFARLSPVVQYAALVSKGGRGGLDAVIDMGESMTDLMNRISIYAAHTPKQARWEAHLILDDLKRDPQTLALLSDVHGSMEAIDQMSDVAVDMESILTQQREAAFEDIHAQLQIALDRLTQEREAILAVVETERVAVTGDLNAFADHVFWRLVQFSLGLILVIVVVVLLLRKIGAKSAS